MPQDQSLSVAAGPQMAGYKLAVTVWGTVTAVFVLGPYLILAAITIVDIGARLTIGQPAISDAFRGALNDTFAVVVAVGLLSGIPYALVRSFATGNPEPPRMRSALALWPGLIAGLVLLLVASTLMSTMVPAPNALIQIHAQGFESLLDHASIGVVFMLIAAAGAAGGKPAHGPAVIASVVVMSFLVGLAMEQSISIVAIGAIVPALLIGGLGAIAYGFGPWRPVMRLQAAAGAVIVFGVLLLPGLVTPTELAAILVAFAVVAWLVRGLTTKDIWRPLDVAVLEIVPLVVLLFAAVSFGPAAAFARWPISIAQILPLSLGGVFAMLIVLVIYALLAIALTPVAALAILIPLIAAALEVMKVDLTAFGALVAVLALLPMILQRGSRQDSSADPAREDMTGMQRAYLAALIVIVVLIGVVAPRIVTALPALIR